MGWIGRLRVSSNAFAVAIACIFCVGAVVVVALLRNERFWVNELVEEEGAVVTRPRVSSPRVPATASEHSHMPRLETGVSFLHYLDTVRLSTNTSSPLSDPMTSIQFYGDEIFFLMAKCAATSCGVHQKLLMHEASKPSPLARLFVRHPLPDGMMIGRIAGATFQPALMAKLRASLPTTQWSFAEMSRFLELLKALFDATSSSIPTSRINPRGHLARQRCLQHLWSRFSLIASATLKQRLSAFGGRKRNNGRLVIAAGFQSLITTAVKGTSFRVGWYPQKHILRAAQTHATNFTILFLTFHDEDVYFQTRYRLKERLALHRLLGDFPNLFFLHYSPSVVVDHVARANQTGLGALVLGSEDPFYAGAVARGPGTLFPRMIPVPHSLTQEGEVARIVGALANSSSSSNGTNLRSRQLKSAVVWRGATTGRYPAPYRYTDRYRLVEAFQSLGSYADVGFSGLCQGVKEWTLPHHDKRLKPRMSVKDMLRFKVQLDVDGNTNSWEGLRWRLRLGTVVVKLKSSHGFVQWYYRFLRNGTHLFEARSPEEAVSIATNLLRVSEKENTSMEEYGDNVARAAKQFGDQFLSHAAIDHAVEDAVQRVWYYGYFASDVRWTIRM